MICATGKDHNFAVVQFLVESGAHVNAVARNRSTPLLEAAGKGDLDVIRFLVERGALINIADASGETALMHAAEAGGMDVACFLVDNGASVNAANNYRWIRPVCHKEWAHRRR